MNRAVRIIIFIALSGAILSLFPVPERPVLGQVGGGGGGMPLGPGGSSGCFPRYTKDGRILFGGKIQEVTVCTCPVYAFMKIRVGCPAPAEIVLTYSTLQYRWYAYFTNNWTLGDAALVQVPCMMYAGTSCVQNGQGYPAIHIGTSLTPKSSSSGSGSGGGSSSGGSGSGSGSGNGGVINPIQTGG